MPIRVNRTTDTRVFSLVEKNLLAIFISKLPGRPLLKLHYNAERCVTHSRKTHAA